MENLRGSVLMVMAMAGFALEDMFIKHLAGSMPVGQIIATIGLGGAVIFAAICAGQGRRLFSRDLLARSVLLRNAGEMAGTMCFVTAIALTPLSQASAILQATPLAVTLGAALFLREPVGWKRWSAILVGFGGVLLVIRPGMQGFDANSLFAVQGVIGLAIRDLATRRIPRETSSMQLSFLAFLTLIPAALILALFSRAPGVVPTAHEWGLVAGAIVMGVLAYYAIVTAMRVGEVSYVTPFRYSRIVFALIVGWYVFQERPDGIMLLGAAVIVGSGLFTLWRERKHRAPA